MSCVGRCDKAPVAVVGKNTIEYATPTNVDRAVKNKEIKPAQINPISLDDYLKSGGYSTFKKCLANKLHRNDIIEILKNSNLKGLGEQDSQQV